MILHPQWQGIIKVIISIILGGLIGLERELASKPAGLRTHMLVAGSATLFVILGDFLVQYFVNGPLPNDVLRGDPIRIMQAIITGISFLGAGTIIFRGHRSAVEGLTTAASILFVSGIGMAVAIGETLMAVILTVLVVGILLIVGKLERLIQKRVRHTNLEDGERNNDGINKE